MTERTGDWMQTYLGGQFWPLDPRPEEINIRDIAHALASQCRYGGHTTRFYSVAEHSVFVALNTPLKDRLAALMHDASEAYLQDVIRPIKSHLTGYKAIEDKLMRVIAEKFGFGYPLPEIVHINDNRILLDERELFMAPTDDDWSIPYEPLGVQLRGWDPANAEAAFLHVFYTLGHETAGRA